MARTSVAIGTVSRRDAMMARPAICAAIAAEHAHELYRTAATLARDGLRFVEVRLDYARAIADALRAVSAFAAAWAGVRVLATCRPQAYGGRFEGEGVEELDVLEAAIAAGARDVDVALHTAEAVAAASGGSGGARGS